MSVISLTLSNYIMIAEMLGLWVLLDSNIHLKRRTINVTRCVIVLIFIEAICWAVERLWKWQILSRNAEYCFICRF